MHIEFLVEEPSAEVALKHLLPKLVDKQAKWKVISLRSKYRLLKVLPNRLAAYHDRIQSGENLRVVVLLDRDEDDCRALKRRLEGMAREAGLPTESSPDTQGRFLS